MKVCLACHEKNKASSTANIFDVSGNIVPMNLCRNHDIELYKLGQRKFLMKYNLKLPKGPYDISDDKQEFEDL